MSNVQQGPTEKWTRFNHFYVSGRSTDEGYAVCQNCGWNEQDREIEKPCPEGPVLAYQADFPQ